MGETFRPAADEPTRMLAEVARSVGEAARMPSGIEAINVRHLSPIPVCQLARLSGPAIASGASWVTLGWDTEIRDDWGMHSAGGGGIVAQIPGEHLVMAQVAFAPDGAGVATREMRVVRSDGQVIAVAVDPDPQVGDLTYVQLTSTAHLSIGESLRVDVRQGSGGSLDLSLLQHDTYFHVVRLGT